MSMIALELTTSHNLVVILKAFKMQFSKSKNLFFCHNDSNLCLFVLSVRGRLVRVRVIRRPVSFF